jgi:PLD-like domain
MQQNIQTSHTGKQWIQESIGKGLVSADICSAYIRSEAFRYFFEGIFNTGVKIRVLARWASNDLLSQASDLATYRLCREKNIAFYIKQDFHGKLYGLAPHGVLLGSFNLTNRGFSISNAGNDEAGVLIESDQDSDGYFNQLFSSAKLVDDYLYEKILNFIEENGNKDTPNIPWPEDITDLMVPPASQSTGKILVNECFATTFNAFMVHRTSARLHDLSLLSIEEQHADDVPLIRAQFRKTKLVRWFIKSLSEQAGDVYFGRATAMLHDQLFDDPKPYRQEVKTLLINLLSWIEGLGLEEIRIDRPNHSQRIALKKKG